MLTIWSPKGGCGTSVVAAAVALHLARSGGARLVDLGGDQPALLGLPTEPDTGVLDWLAVPDSPPSALDRLGVEAAPGLVLISRGRGLSARPDALVDALRGPGLPTVVDAGVPESPVARAVVDAADASVVVLRPSYLALRRAVTDPSVRAAAGMVVVEDRHDHLAARDVGEIVGLPVVARLPVRRSVARAVDAGALATRLPEPLGRLGMAVEAVAA